MINDDLERVVEILESRLFGKYRGIVEGNVDDLGKGRLEVSVPTVFGKDVTVWAMPCVPFAGKDIGLFTLPEVKTPVFIEFEAGDPEYPIWTGCFWADGQVPQALNDPKIRFLKSGNLKVILNESDGTLTLKNGENTQIIIRTDEISIEASSIVLKSGMNTVNLTSTGFDVFGGSLKVSPTV